MKKIFHLLLVFVSINACSTDATEKEWLVVNEDFSHFFITRTPDEMDVAHLEAFVDQYAGGKVTHLFLNPNTRRANFRSKTREAVWDPVPGYSAEEVQQQLMIRESYNTHFENAKLLYEKGIDPYDVWIRRCREKGISPWLSMRMNDTHGIVSNSPIDLMRTELGYLHPEYLRDSSVMNKTASCFDYAHQAVRDHQIAFIQELLERYDPDGIELDWLRNLTNLRNGRFLEDAHFIDEFVRDVRQLTMEWAAKSGHAIGVAVRVPSFPDDAKMLGLNADRWAKNGWVDVIIASPHYNTIDYDVRLDLWRTLLGDAATKVRLLAACEFRTQAFPGAQVGSYASVYDPIFNYHLLSSNPNTPGWTDYELPLLYGFVDNARFRGTDGIYLFNWFDRGHTMPPDCNYRKLLAEGVKADIVAARERRYPVTYRDIAIIVNGLTPPGFSYDTQLPKETDVAATIHMPMGSVPKNGAVFLILGFDKRDGLESAMFTASLNGVALGPHEDEHDLWRLAHPQRAVRFRCPLEALRAGENEMILQPTTGETQRLIWAELRYEPSISGCSSGVTKKELFIINEDFSHFFYTRTQDEMDVAHLEAFIDQYAGGKVTHLFLNPNARKANFRSKTREAFWDPVPGYSAEEVAEQLTKRPEYKVHFDNVRLLYEKGIDPYDVWIRRCREKDISPWLSMRMNDTHRVGSLDQVDLMRSEFWNSHPELWREPNVRSRAGSCFDYAHQAVRDHQFAFIQELLERYDPDGIELDWTRHIFHLRKDHIHEDAHFIDGFVRDVRKLTNEWAILRGHDIGLAVRIPSFPDDAEMLGLNADRWAKNGWVDMLIAAPHYETTDYDVRLDRWRERIGEAATRIRLLAACELRTQAFPDAQVGWYLWKPAHYQMSSANNSTPGWTDHELPLLYGFIDNARFRGTDGIYLFNWFDSGHDILSDNYRKLLSEGVEPEIVTARERRYPVTYRDNAWFIDLVISPPAFSYNTQLPKETDMAATIHMPMGNVPKNGAVFLILGFDKRDGIESATFTASLNGVTLGPHEDENDLWRLAHPQRAVRFRCPLEALRAGENEMTLQPTTGDTQRLIWAELRYIP